MPNQGILPYCVDEHRRLFNAAILKYLKKVADETESVIDESEIVHQPKKHKSAAERKSKVKWYIDSSCFETSYLSILRQITIFNEDEYEDMKKYLNDGVMAVPNILKKKVWSFRKNYATIQYSSHESYIVNKKDIEKATLPGRGDNLVDFAKLRRCITSTELFDRLREVHMDQGHGAARKTHEAANQRYSNVTRTMCELYVQFCSCQLDSKLPGRPEQVKPIISETINVRGQVDLIDMQAYPDGKYKWLLHYQDHHDKFSYLRPMENKTAVCVARELFQIFCMQGNVLEH